MNWIRTKLHAWLSIDAHRAKIVVMQNEIENLQADVHSLKGELAEFKDALKKRATAPVRVVPRYPDYETAQVEALQEFQEKN